MKINLKRNFFYLTALALACISLPSLAKTTHHNAFKKISHDFATLCRNKQFSGTALIAIDGKVKFRKACGLASRNFGAPVTIDTKFNLGSVGKLFTITSIAQLIDHKKLALNSAVQPIIPSWLPMKGANAITVEQLFIHASGLGNFMNDNRWKLGADSGLYITTNQYKPLVTAEKLLFKPGSSQAYSNSGYMTLGALIEKIAKQPYDHYLKRHIFSKAHMKNSGIFPLDNVIKNRAVGYYYSCKQKPCRWKNNYFQAPFVGTPAGGAYSTVDDLFNFSQALYHHKLLSPQLTKHVLANKIVRTPGKTFIKKLQIGSKLVPEHFSRYGFAGIWNQFGFAVWKDPALIGHTGGTAGATALFLMSPNNKYTIILLSNLSGGTTELYVKIREALGYSGKIKNF